MIFMHIARLWSAWKVWRQHEAVQSVPQVWMPRVLGAEFESDTEGEVVRVLKEGEEWRVKYSATSWPARSSVVLHLSPGDEIRVVGRQGGALLIEPITKD